jgi:uncharacterized protein YjlB
MPAGDPARVVAHRLAASGAIPNHPQWPLLVYPGAVAITGADPAVAFEALFDRNRWPAAWRNGVFPFHHFHTTAHEALGVYSGEVTVQFGGDGGVVVTARPGDVIVLPAGTGHKKLDSRGALGIVGAYRRASIGHVHAAVVERPPQRRGRGARPAPGLRSGLRRGRPAFHALAAVSARPLRWRPRCAK